MYLQMAQSWVLCGVRVDSAQPGTKLPSLIILERRAYVRFQYQTSQYQQCYAQALPNVTVYEVLGLNLAEFVTEGYDGEFLAKSSICGGWPREIQTVLCR